MIYWMLLIKLESMNIKQDCKTYKVTLFKKNLAFMINVFDVAITPLIALPLKPIIEPR